MIPIPSETELEKIAGRNCAEHIERLTASLHPEVHRLIENTVQRLDLPEIPVYIISGDESVSERAFFVPRHGAVLIGEHYLEPPLQNYLETTFLHEVGHGFQDERFLHSAGNAVDYLERLTLASLWSDLLYEASSCLYTAATLVFNAVRMIDEFDADKFARRHAEDPSRQVAFHAECFRQRYGSDISPGEEKFPFSPLAILKEAADFLDNLHRYEHPPTSIRYLLGAHELRRVTRENQEHLQL